MLKVDEKRTKWEVSHSLLVYLIPKVDNYKESNKEGLVGEQKYVSTNAYKYG